jgi:integrase/recombinase XerD
MGHLSRWLACEGRDAQGLTPAVADRFLAARRAAGYVLYLSPKALVPLLGYLRRAGAIPPAEVPVPASPADALLGRYRRYLVTECGLAPATARGYADTAPPFLVRREEAGALDLACLTAAEVTGFVVAACPGMRKGSAKLTVTALRSLLGYLHVAGRSPGHWPGRARGRQLAACRAAPCAGAGPGRRAAGQLRSRHRRGPAGSRDAYPHGQARAACRGGRRADPGRHRLAGREITVRGKGNRSKRLPLPADAGEAVAVWLRDGRPEPFEGTRRVFLRVRAPHRGLTSGVSPRRCSPPGSAPVPGPVRAHRLRHYV